jgi:hypothetical protein
VPPTRRFPVTAGMLVMLGLASSASATLVTIQPSNQDAYIQQDKPNRTAGSGITNTRIRVMSSTPNPRIRRGLVQFDLSGIPQFSTINSAVLSLYEANNPAVSRTHGVHRVNDPWLQSTVKWSTQPTIQAIATALTAVGTSTGFKAFTVTGDVQAWTNNPTANHGWMVKDTAETTGNNEIAHISKEEDHIPDLPNRPKLVIDFTAPSCVTNADCADTTACTTNERCVTGFCVVDSVNCDDANACTDDICDPQQGCLHPIGECNDGFDCTTDSCDPLGGCSNTPVNSFCTNGGCKVSTCVADPDDTNVDPVTGCVTTSVNADGSPCDSDAVECTDDICAAGTCTHPDTTSGTACTSDGNSCTDDVCDGSGGCGVNNTDGCNDGDACTQTDVCTDGACVGGNDVVCTALGECYDVGTCNTLSGLCSNPPKPNGTGCSVDGNACTDDVCDGAGVCGVNNSNGCDDGDLCTQIDQCSGGTCVGSNDVVCPLPDQCHLQGTCSPGTGVCSNPSKANGTGCSDGNTCTLADQCLAGTCQGNPMTCGDGIVQGSCGEQCDDQTPGANCTAQCQFICGPAPQSGCRDSFIPKKSLLVLKDKSPDKKDTLVWKWLKGSATVLADFGDPLNTTSYALCLYDQTGVAQPRILAMIPAGGICSDKPCWKPTKKGLKYKDKELTPDGILNVLLLPGVDGEAKVIVKGKGANVGMPTLPPTTPVTVQLKRIDNAGICFNAAYTTPIKNLPDQFKAKSD